MFLLLMCSWLGDIYSDGMSNMFCNLRVISNSYLDEPCSACINHFNISNDLLKKVLHLFDYNIPTNSNKSKNELNIC